MAIVGRPNVGKSALFNRLMGERRAIVEDLPGTTRDRLYGDVEWRGRTFSVVDTGGLDPGLDRRSSRGASRGGRVGAGEEPKGDVLRQAVRAQADAAIEEADLILFVVDARAGLLGVESDVADLLRRSGKPVLLVANKAESWRGEAQAHEFHRLGLGGPHAVSALHGTGAGDLLDALLAALPERREPAVAADARIAIVGRPNVGKSSLLNAIVGSERAVVGPLPGTTRDPVDTFLERDGRRLLLVDTAGLRRRGHIEPGLEAHAALRTVRAVDRSDVAVVLLDATQGITAQDLHVVGYVIEAYKGLVVGLNKWDAVERGEAMTAAFRQELRRALRFALWAPQLFLSAKTGRGVAAVVDAAVSCADERRKRVPTGDLRRFLVDAVGRRPPPAGSGAQPRFTHVVQGEGPGEPVFMFFVSRPDGVHFTYRRYLENELRKRFGFEGTPLRLVFRGGERS